MSVVTDLLIMCPNGDDFPEPVAAINRWCDERARGQQFKPLDTSKAGGPKVFTSSLYACSGNYFPIEEFVEAFASNAFGWDDYHKTFAVLVYKYEHADDVRCVRADGLELKSAASIFVEGVA